MTLTRILRTTRTVFRAALVPERVHYVSFRDVPLAYGRVPKVANTSIKTALLTYVSNGEALRKRASLDAVWREETNGETRMLRTSEAARLDGVFVFSFIRNPFDRVASFYNDKVTSDTALPVVAARDGVVKGMAFGAFLEQLAVMDDRDMDDHLLPQSVILTHAGTVVPQFVGRHERIAEDWTALRRALTERGLADPGLLPTRNRRAPAGHDLAAYYADPAHIRMVRERYACDFELFYPDADPLQAR